MRIYSVTRSNSLPTSPTSELAVFDRNITLESHFEEEDPEPEPRTPPPDTRTKTATRTGDTPGVPGIRGVDPRPMQAPPAGPLPSTTADPSTLIDIDYNSTVQGVDASLFPNGGLTVSDPEVIRRPSIPLSEIIPVARRGRQFGESQAARKVTRLVQKNGRSNVTIKKASRKNRRFIRDFFTTIMDLKLRYHILLFISGFIVSWLLFAIGWLGIASTNGYIPRQNPDNTTNNCLVNVYDFNTALLFSIEMQTTIGFGYRLIGQHCPMATALMMLQSLFATFVNCFITGVVFAKIARPLRRAQTIVFSQCAVICVRDGFYNLIFRVGDLRKTHIIGTSIRALLIRSRKTSEGELIPLCQYPLDLVTESSITDSFVFFFWPVTVAHRITESSPLWNLSAESILTDLFEVIVILEGTVQTSGSLIQIKTSYIPKEIKWGQRPTPLVTTHRMDGEYEIDYSYFHDTTPIVMPDCSAAEYANRVATNHLAPIGSGYPASLSSPPVFGELEEHNSFHLAFKDHHHHNHHHHHHAVQPKQAKAAKSSKDVRQKGRVESMARRGEQEAPGGSNNSSIGSTVQVPQIVVHLTAPPPNYDSLSGIENPDQATSTQKTRGGFQTRNGTQGWFGSTPHTQVNSGYCSDA